MNEQFWDYEVNNRHRFEQTAIASCFNFFPTAQKILKFIFANRTKHTFIFFASHKPDPKKMKECFRQRLIPLRSKLLKKIVNKLFNILHHEQNLILSLRQLKAGATL